MDNFYDLFMVSPLLLVVLFFVAVLAGFIDSIAGGGGLLTIPALMAAGMSPANALATNKLQACGGSLSSSLYFIRRKVVNLAEQKLNILMTFIGSMSGALLVQHVQADILRQILPILVIFIGLYFFIDAEAGRGRSPAPPVWITVRADSRGDASGFTTAFSGLPPGRFTLWRLSPYVAITWRNPRHMPKCLTLPPTLAACCYLSSAAK